MVDSLAITWTDHRGKVWDLGTGAQGVILDLELEGLGWAELEHTFTRGALAWSAGRVQRGVHALKVLVGWDRTGADYYRLADEWWTEANSPFHIGVLQFTRPDGVSRSRRLRLFESPGSTLVHDPGLGLENGPELWSLTGDGGYWDGPEQSYIFRQDQLTSGSGVPFYGEDGAGWPLYISAGASAGDAHLDNNGQGPMWLTWTLTGPLSSARFGLAEDGRLAYTGYIAAGEQVEVTTQPGDRRATEVSSGDNRYGFVTGHYSPVPVGERVPLTIVAEGMDAESSIIAIGREQFARAF